MLYRFCILCLGMPFFLVACSGLKPGEQPSVAETPSSLEATVEPAVAEAPPPAIARRSVEDDVRRLLDDAETALAADRLTTPLHDNAFDRFQAVLLLRPGNEQAKSGLQQVFVRYVGMIRSALARNQPGAARALIERARLVDHDHPMLAELSAEISVVQKRLAAQTSTAADKDKEIILDTADLDRRDDTVVEKLKSLAAQIKNSEETMLIVARNDAEGRWIYQRMSEGVPDYRLRGDIRLGRVPKILLLPPIE